MIRPPPRSTLTVTLFPYTTLCRSLETVQVEEQHGEAGALPAVHARYRRVQALEHDDPVGQAGQAVVAGLVGEFLLRAHALADLRAQLAIGAFQLARPRLDAELELGVRGLEVLLRALARQCAVAVVGDEGEQLLVARSEADLRRVALRSEEHTLNSSH